MAKHHWMLVSLWCSIAIWHGKISESRVQNRPLAHYVRHCNSQLSRTIFKPVFPSDQRRHALGCLCKVWKQGLVLQLSLPALTGMRLWRVYADLTATAAVVCTLGSGGIGGDIADRIN